MLISSRGASGSRVSSASLATLALAASEIAFASRSDYEPRREATSVDAVGDDPAAKRVQVARAEDASPTRIEWLLGAALLNTPAYVGSDRRVWKPRPLWSVRYGRFALTGPRAGVGRSFAEDSPSVAGASAALYETDRVKLALGLRLDSGRKSGDDPLLAGLPDLNRRALYSLNTRYVANDNWSLNASVSGDVRSTETGMTFSTGVAHRTRLAPRWLWSSSINATLADRHYLSRFHGVASVPPGSTLTVFEPRAGLRDIGVNTTVRYQFNRSWVGFGALGSTRLLGDAARSPLTTIKQQSSLMIGFAYNHGSTTVGE